ncbi:adenylate/guanylate cyclase domain-containing protein [Ruegeria lacuscaerulensis]|uniref:adenylate/guanylate cyclase domain-containing protein n=1 Tax=Ruegeria lacuscaerulensis TaxID=55218 RepID=UPI00148056C6|nr:adenylate/guanylate cyclase domain-containing protein [Ruegeria lacuscaerulensis]
MKVRLHIGVATLFTFLTLAVTTLLVAILYFGNKELAIRTANERMTEARNQSVEEMLTVIRGAGNVVSSASVFLSKFSEYAGSSAGLEVLYSQMQGNEHYYGLYFGEEKSGDFFQNINLPKHWKTFGPTAVPVPEGVDRVQRIITDQSGERVETYFWSNGSSLPTPFRSGTAVYDPRTRPWYRGALEQSGIYVSPLYQFESTGRLGATFSKTVIDNEGKLLGVVALDITISALSQILDDIRIGDHGLVFMLDREGRLLSYTSTRSKGGEPRFVSSNTNGSIEGSSKIIDSVIDEWRASQQDFFRIAPESDGRSYITSVMPIPEVFGAQPTLGLIVPEDEFIGDIKRNTTRAMQFGVLALTLAVAFTFVVARLLSKNLVRVAAEARKVSNFELSEDLNLKSNIQEVAELETAIASMKAGLSSFGAFVPKELVRSILSKAERISVGGESRDVTLMFADLKGFTRQTEGLEPEVLMPALSEYFEAMEKEISGNQGTVDKYIGDAIMALWNAPLDDTDHPVHACRAALACLQAEASLNSDNGALPLRPLQTRFGLHTGRVVVGNVGSLSRLQYTALGAAVNFASRLEGLNKVYGTRVLVSSDVAVHVESMFLLREVDHVVPAGTSFPSRIFELIAEKDDESGFLASVAKKRELEEWRVCYDLYQSGKWADALEALQTHREIATNKLVVDVFIERCSRFAFKPPAAWDGVYRFEKK